MLCDGRLYSLCAHMHHVGQTQLELENGKDVHSLTCCAANFILAQGREQGQLQTIEWLRLQLHLRRTRGLIWTTPKTAEAITAHGYD